VGHTSSVSNVCVDANLNQVISLSTDKTIKIWDLRNNRCIQTMVGIYSVTPSLPWVGPGSTALGLTALLFTNILDSKGAHMVSISQTPPPFQAEKP
jgi:WD40 repeat protein